MSIKGFPKFVNFVTFSQNAWPELQNSSVPIMDDEALIEKRSFTGHDVWIVQTYLRLKRRGLPVTLSKRPVPHAINVVHIRPLTISRFDPNMFFVVTRADGHPSQLAHFEILSNQCSTSDAPSAFVPHWPQPNIQARDPKRGIRIDTISFKGRLDNIDPYYLDSTFINGLEKRGIRFLEYEMNRTGTDGWGDYRDVDLVIGVRNLTLTEARNKPASKLVNAWHAEVPALLGPEPAFQELRRSTFDYIEIRRPDNTLEAIDQLRADPTFYVAMIENGRQRREAFTVEAVANHWIEVFSGPVQSAYQRWQRSSLAERLTLFCINAFKEKCTRINYNRKIVSGRGILE